MERFYSNKVIYQIYPKSFCDTNHDGIGDLNGITLKLDYLAHLGIDCIWLNACFASPQKDNGYDVSDYYQIAPEFGTLADFERLCQEAKKRNIEIMLDMVFNHTSTEHSWFKKALAGDKTYQDKYFFLPPTDDGGAPANWGSKFGGNAFEYVPHLNLYYLHLFDVSQADLNWKNPAVQAEMINIVKFWQAKGANGFRFDVINLISKPEIFEDDNAGDGRRYYTDGPQVSEYLKLLNKQAFGSNPEAITVGEMSSTTLEKCVHYANKSQDQLSMIFNFHHLKVDYANNNKWVLGAFDFHLLKSIMFEWQLGMQSAEAWMALFWCNHDQPRVVSRFGNEDQYRDVSAKMLATTIHMMRGTPYIYQGEEIGMGNAHFDSIDQYQDIESINYYHILKASGLSESEILTILGARSRDNARTPMVWDNSEFVGFSTNQPWIAIPNNAREVTVVDNLQKADSIFYHYQKLIKLRKEYAVIAEGSIQPLLIAHDSLFAYERIWENEQITQSLICINNFFEHECKISIASLNLATLAEFNEYTVLLNNYAGILELKGIDHIAIQPYQSIVLFRQIAKE